MLGPVRYRHVVVAVRGERLALTSLSVGPTDQSPGAPRDELLQLYGLDEEGRIALHMWFDIDDMDAAIAELDAAYARLDGRRPRSSLENAASRADALFNALFAERRWNEAAALWADDTSVEDRRRGLRRDAAYDRATGVAEIQAMADLGVTMMTSHVIAIRGERLALLRCRYSGRDQRPDAFHTEAVRITEVDTDGRVSATIAFDPDDIDAAFAELDARYLAGEAAPHAQTWSVVVSSCSAINRQELPPATSDSVNIDHRRGTPFASSDMTEIISTSKNITPEFRSHIEIVHALSDIGAVVTSRSFGASQQGFEAEWRVVLLQTVDGDRMNRNEIFDEEDIETALARFDELDRPARQLENTASRVNELLNASFTARDWTAMAEILADDSYGDDRRRVVNVDLRGQRALIDSFRSAADLGGIPGATVETIATRAERLVLTRTRYSLGDAERTLFQVDLLQVVEVDADDRVAAIVTFDAGELDTAVAELDSRYLVGEAAAHAHTWAVIARNLAAFNRGERSTTTPNWVTIDHRRVARFAPEELAAAVTDAVDPTPEFRAHNAAVHRLSHGGAVVTTVSHGTSNQGFEAEWNVLQILTIDGELISRCELFDEADLDAALARFDELTRPAARLDNATNRVVDRYLAHFATRDWDVMADALAEDISTDDRRRVVNAGARSGRDAEIANMQAMAEVGCTNITSTAVAIRGERLVLALHSFTAPDWPGLDTETIDVVESSADGRIVAEIAFDPDDIAAAIAELDARYLAGEAAAHAHTWSVVTGDIRRDQPT